MIPTDTAIVCPKCWKEIGRTLKPIDFGQQLHAADFKMFPRIPVGTDQFKSLCCQVPWYHQGSISLAEGWVPPQPMELDPE